LDVWYPRREDAIIPRTDAENMTRRATRYPLTNPSRDAGASFERFPEYAAVLAAEGSPPVAIPRESAVLITIAAFWRVERSPLAVPLRFNGTFDMMNVVLGVMKKPEPNPVRLKPRPIGKYEAASVELVPTASIRSPSAVMPRPAVARSRVLYHLLA
jgi:hypothetical protein